MLIEEVGPLSIRFNSDEVEFLTKEFHVNVDSVELVKVEGLNKGTRVYRVTKPMRSKVYLIDSLAGMKIGCHPSIVGAELDNLSLKAAIDASLLMVKLGCIKEVNGKVFVHALRAAPGYKLLEAFENLGMKFKQVWIRPRYTKPSYRDHEGLVKKIEIVYENFDNFPENKELCLIKPDTEASGRTSEAILKRTIDVAERKNSEIKSIILYGYISEHGLKHIEKVLEALGVNVKIYAFAIGNLTALYYNKYDMPLYGPDESYYSMHREIRKLGGLVARETFERYLPEFIPGSDQPGDWSARQLKVFNGYGYEDGGISIHLKNSVSFIKRLYNIYKTMPSLQIFLPRYKEMIKKELNLIKLTQKVYG